MIRFHQITVFIFFLLFAGCSLDKKPAPTPEKNKVIITTLDSARQSKLSGKQASLKYLDQYAFPHTIYLAENQVYKIPVTKKYFEISYLDRNNKLRYFLFNKGDSLRLGLDGNWPRIEILNRSVNKYESNFERSIQQDLYDGKPSSLENFYYYWRQVNNAISPITGEVIAEELNYLKQRVPQEISNENQYIDSLLESGRISQDIAEYYQSKNAFELKKIQLYDPDRINFEDSILIEPIISLINNPTSDSTWDSGLKLFESDFISLHHLFYLFPRMGKMESLDSLLNVDFYKTNYGKHLLYNHIDRLLFDFSVKDGNRILQNVSLDSTWTAYFKSNYSLEVFNTDWIITDRFYKAQSFNNLLTKHSGSFIFLYLWSVPCPYHLKVMPVFIRLMEEYTDENIVFIPIAISPGKEEWKWRDNKYFGASNVESYQIDSLDIQKIKRRFIPRFLLFGPDGNLLHGNAPRANSDEVRPFLDGYLKKEIPLEDPS